MRRRPWPQRYRPRRCGSRHGARRWGAGSASSRASGGCGCRCPGRACRTATPGRSPPATGSCSSTAACTSAARWRTSSGRWSRSDCGWSRCGCSSAPTRTSTTAGRRRRSRRGRAASCGSTRATSTSRPATARPRCAADRGRAPERRAGGAAAALGRARARRTTAACRARCGQTRDLVPGVEVVTDHGAWQVHETPGHAPSHVVLHHARAAPAALGRPRARPDLALLRPRLDARTRSASSCASLDVVDALDVRLSLSGHGRPFTDLHGHVEGNRALVARAARRGAGPRSPAPARRRRSTSCPPSTARS